MPLKRYFSFVGGALLALLFILDAYLPKLPASDRGAGNLPTIRIHSDRKWPERVVYDTSHPPIVPTFVASSEVIVGAPIVMTEAPAGPRKWEAFAMLPPPGAQLQASSTKMREPKPRQRGKFAKKHMPMARFAMASRVQFSQFRQSGLYARSFW
jgi:hypothetical protein